MKTLKKIIKITLFYGGFYVIEKVLLSQFLLLYLKNGMSFFDILLKVISGNINLLIKTDWISTSVYLFSNLLELIVFYIFTSYIFMFIINRESRVFLPPKLVIRYRTSEEVNGKLTLGVIAENRNKFNVYNVKCTVIFRYVKKEIPLLLNSETILESTHPIIQNYYRFSFDLKDFPRKVLSDYLDKNTTALKEDAITIFLTGNVNFGGNTFGISKKYKLSDVMIADHDIKDIKTKKIFKREVINWAKLETPLEIPEDKRTEIIEEIKKIESVKKAREPKESLEGEILPEEV